MSSSSHVFYRNLRNAPTKLVRGRGSYVFDEEGKAYLDGAGGVAVVSIGHGVDAIYSAIRASGEEIVYGFGGAGFTTRWQEELAAALVAIAPQNMQRAYLASGGSEANETAIKMAREYHVKKGNPQKHKIISRAHSFHGVTLATLALSGRKTWRSPYDPYLFMVPRIPPPRCGDCECAGGNLACLDMLDDIVKFEGPETVSAFIAEPIVGTSNTGLVPPAGYYERAREICDRHDILFIADEVLCGYGRCGIPFSIEYWNAAPDIMTVGKGVSSGYAPLGAAIASEEVVNVFQDVGSGEFTHGFTHSGNAMACRIGLAVHHYVQEHDLFRRSAEMGGYLHDKLKALQSRQPKILEVRGRGLLAGVVLESQPDRHIAREVVEYARNAGVLLLPGVQHPDYGGNIDHLQITPPYCIDNHEVDELIDVLEAALR